MEQVQKLAYINYFALCQLETKYDVTVEISNLKKRHSLIIHKESSHIMSRLSWTPDSLFYLHLESS